MFRVSSPSQGQTEIWRVYELPESRSRPKPYSIMVATLLSLRLHSMQSSRVLFISEVQRCSGWVQVPLQHDNPQKGDSTIDFFIYFSGSHRQTFYKYISTSGEAGHQFVTLKETRTQTRKTILRLFDFSVLGSSPCHFELGLRILPP